LDNIPGVQLRTELEIDGEFWYPCSHWQVTSNVFSVRSVENGRRPLTLFTKEYGFTFRKVKVKQKNEGVLFHAMKAYRGRRGITPLILNLGTRWM
jgi:hypothetical protein